MLTKTDAEQLLEQLYATAEVLGSEIKPAAASLIVRDLRQHHRAEVEQALARCRSELTGRLTLAAILERMPSANAFLSANEAWALALTGQDEMETVIWTNEVAAAMSVAGPVLALGDKVGARMAFIGAYEREVAQAKAEGRKPEWTVSLGHSPERRQTAIDEGIKKGLLEAPKVDHLLPAPQGLGAPDKNASKPDQEKQRQNLQRIRDILNDGLGASREAEEKRREQEEARRRELLAQADQRMTATGGC